jgi:hypothetical protein
VYQTRPRVTHHYEMRKFLETRDRFITLNSEDFLKIVLKENRTSNEVTIYRKALEIVSNWGAITDLVEMLNKFYSKVTIADHCETDVVDMNNSDTECNVNLSYYDQMNDVVMANGLTNFIYRD